MKQKNSRLIKESTKEGKSRVKVSKNVASVSIRYLHGRKVDNSRHIKPFSCIGSLLSAPTRLLSS